MPSRIFIIVVCTVLALLHIYIGWRILPDLAVPTAYKVMGGVWLLSSSVLVPAGMRSRAWAHPPWSDRLAWAGMLAMGLFSSLLMLTFFRDMLFLLCGMFNYYNASLLRDSAAMVPLLALAVSIIGFFNARRVASVREVDVPIAKLPPGLHGFTIAQISDIHVGPTIKHGYLDAIVDKVNLLLPDLIAVTGDLVDGSVKHLAPHTSPLEKLSARHGVYFVTGNHEYYSNANDWIAEIRRLGLTVLMNEHVVLTHQDATLMVAGVTDYTAHQHDESHRSDPHAAMAGVPAHVAFKLLLAHQPRSADAAADAGFDLQLSGHTHGGQFFPWNLFVPLQQPFTAGLNRLRKLWVYTSRGTGYWGPPKRLWAPSEITRLRLVSAD